MCDDFLVYILWRIKKNITIFKGPLHNNFKECDLGCQQSNTVKTAKWKEIGKRLKCSKREYANIWFGMQRVLLRRSRVEAAEFALSSASYKGLGLAVFWQYSDPQIFFKYPQFEVFSLNTLLITF